MSDDNLKNETAVLFGGRGGWIATPWDYSSCRYLRLMEGGFWELIYGYGQTIYSRCYSRWEVISPGRLRLTYVQAPPLPARLDPATVPTYTPSDDTPVRELDFVLTAGEVSFKMTVVGFELDFRWTLELSEPPWPTDLQLPYKVPRVFYGHAKDHERQSEAR
jgi:hypothetical protein